MEFKESMIGKQVKQIDSGDFGIVRSAHDLRGESVWVDWDDCGLAWIDLGEIVFTDDIASFEEITINDQRYKLTPIE